MTSLRLSLTPSRRVAARFVHGVRRAVQEALVEEQVKRGLTQSDIARTIDVHRSVINREIRGQKDLTLGRLAELAFAMGRTPVFELRPIDESKDQARRNSVSFQTVSSSSAANLTSPSGELPAKPVVRRLSSRTA